jgi:pyruvate dehydrogenase E1 component beta subunit
MISYRDALAQAQIDAMDADPNVFVFGLDVRDHKKIFGSTKGLERFDETRFFPTPLSEDAMTGVALGAAISGLRPIHVHIRTDFMLLGTNQIANMISCLRYLSGGKLKVPMVIRAVIGRGWGQGAQHSKTLHSMYAHIPGLKVVMPTTPQDAYSLLRSSINDDNPVIFIEHRWLYDVTGEVDTSQKEAIGSAKVLHEGADVTLVCVSWMNVEAIKAAEILARQGVKAEIIDVRSITPLDMETILKSVKKTGRCIVSDYDWNFCGLGAEISAQLSEQCFSELKAPVARLGFQPVPCPTTRPLENLFYPSAPQIIRKVEEMLKLPAADFGGEEFYSYERKFKGPF